MRSSFPKSSYSGTSSAVSRDPRVSRVESSHSRKKQGGERRRSPRKTRAPSIDEQESVCDQTDEVLTKVGLDQGRGLDTESVDILTVDGGGGWQVTEKEAEAEAEAEEEGWIRDLNGVKIAEEEPWVEKGGGVAVVAPPGLLQGSIGSASDETNSDKRQSDTLSPAPFRRPRCSEAIVPVIDGIRQFGITKGMISRAVVKFHAPPDPHPLVTCFHFPGTFLTHRYVLDMVRHHLKDVPAASKGVSGIQFIDRNTFHGTHGLDNRWLVSLASREAVRVLIDGGLTLFNRRIVVKAYDEILQQEYKEFLDYDETLKKLYATRHQMELIHKQTAELEGGNQ